MQKFATEIGLSLTDKKVTVEEFWKMINAFNKEIVDPKSNRYFFVKDPVEVEIANAPSLDIEFDLHADFPERGKRKANFNGKVLLSKDDFDSLESNKIYRMIDCCNFTFNQGKFEFHSTSYGDFKSAENKGSIMHWLPSGSTIPLQVMTLSGEVIKGVGEVAISNLKQGDIIQFERMFFVKLDSKDDMLFYYLHS